MAITSNEIQTILSAQDKTASAFSSMRRSLSNAETSTTKLTAGFSKIAKGGFLALVINEAVQLSTALVGTLAEIEKVEASLKIATGGGEAFAQVQSDIARQLVGSTSTTVKLTTAYQKMANLGLRPTLEVMKSFENVAVGSGKSLDQFIEAVADASTAEFERLKEFGIKASKQGDQIAFTFRGVTTEVQNSSDQIVGYLQNIGEVEYGGSVTAQLETLTGASTLAAKELGLLKDALVESSGAGGALQSLMTSVAERAQDARLAFEGEATSLAGIEERITRINEKLADIPDITIFNGENSLAVKQQEKYVAGLTAELALLNTQLNNMTTLDNINVDAQGLLAEIAAEEEAESKLLAAREAATAKINDQAAKRIAALRKEIAVFGESNAASKALYDTQNGGLAGADELIKQNVINTARQLDSLKEQVTAQKEFNSLLQQTASPIEAIEQKFAAANDTIDRYNKDRADGEKATFEQRLAVYENFGNQVAEALSKDISLGGISDLDELNDAYESQATKLQKLREGSVLNDQVMYTARSKLYRDYLDIYDELSDKEAAQTEALVDATLGKISTLQQLLSSPLQNSESLLAQDLTNIQAAVNLEQLNGVIDKNALIQAAEQQHQDRLLEIYQQGGQQHTAFLALNSQQQQDIIVGGLREMSASMAGESRTAFEVNKAFAIADVIQSSIKAVSNAYAWGSKYGGPLGGALAATPAAAFGLAQVKQIKNQSFSSSSAATTSTSSGSTVSSDSSDTIENADSSSSSTTGQQVNVYFQSIDPQSGAQNLARIMAVSEELNYVDSNGKPIDYSYGTA